MSVNFKNRDIISISHLTKKEILHLLNLSREIKSSPKPELLKGSVMGSCFFEPSTRTRISFETAMHRLGGNVVGFTDAETTSAKKGEALGDTIKVMGQYVDLIVVRHPLEGSACRAAEATEKPVINGGDGTNQHPTQTLLDLFSIQECQGGLEEITIALVGDLKHGRTAHSLAQACAHFNMRIYFVTPEGLELPQDICHTLRKKSIKFSFHRSIEEIIHKVDILYMTRIQEERFSDRMEFQKVKDNLSLQPEMLSCHAKENLRILHPLPRLNEISPQVDETPHAYYFQQAENGLFVRQALLGALLGKF